MNQRMSSVIATLVLIAAIVALVLSRELIAKLPVGIALQVAAAALMLWARVTFGARSFHAAANPTAGGLVTTGPYRYWRHPIYAAVLIFLWTGVLTQGTAPTLLALLLAGVATIATGVRINAEEKLLQMTFPEYADYAQRTRRLLPFVY